MNSNKMTPRIIGALFIITMIAGMIDVNFAAPILNTSLANFYPNATRMTIGAMLILVMAIGIAGIAVVFYPFLKKHNETIAITYVSFRAIECGLLIVGVISYFILITLSYEYIRAGAPDNSYFTAMAALAIKTRYVAFQISMIILGVNSLFLCHLLLRSNLIPRWLSVWGFIGYALLLASALLDILGMIDTVHGAGMMMYIPGGLWELVAFPLWLLIKGFNPPVIAAGNSKSGD